MPRKGRLKLHRRQASAVNRLVADWPRMLCFIIFFFVYILVLNYIFLCFFFQVFASSLYFKNRFVSHQQLNRCHSGCMYICVGCGISCCVNLFSRNGCFYAVSIRRTRTKRIQRSSGFIIFTAIFSILA